MADYIYLLENRLSADQQSALRLLREVAREAQILIFLTGDSVRDLTSGHAVRDLEVAVHGNALKLKKSIEKVGGKIWGDEEASKTLYTCFPGTVRVDVVSTHRLDYPKPGKAVYHPATILDDLRRRDFTVNAMAISLNEGSFGLLMDPLNGVADIEARCLRLVSNYGFIEEPALLIRAVRLQTRLGWDLDPKTRARYENAVADNTIESLSETARSRELEQIGHEEEGLKVLEALEGAGWMKVLFPAWTSAKADREKLALLHDLAVELLVEGVHPDISAAQMQLLTAKMAPREISSLKKAMLRPGFVEEWNSLDALAAKFARVLLAKENATASAAYKLFTNYDPEAILWLGFTSRDAAVKERFNQFLKVWPEARQRIPHALMQEMRITPELAAYKDVVHQVFLQLIDGKLGTAEEMRAFLEPHSPPAPPPQFTVKRTRAKRPDAKIKDRSFDDEDGEAGEDLDADGDLDEIEGDDEELDLRVKLPKSEMDEDGEDESESGVEDLEAEDDEPAPKRGGKAIAPAKVLKTKVTPAAAPSESAKPKEGPASGSSKTASSRTLSSDRKTAPQGSPTAAPAASSRSKPTALKPAAPAAEKVARPAAKNLPGTAPKTAPKKAKVSPKPMAKPASAKKTSKPEANPKLSHGKARSAGKSAGKAAPAKSARRARAAKPAKPEQKAPVKTAKKKKKK